MTWDRYVHSHFLKTQASLLPSLFFLSVFSLDKGAQSAGGRLQFSTSSGISLSAVAQYWSLLEAELTQALGILSPQPTVLSPQSMVSCFHLIPLVLNDAFSPPEDGRGKPRPTKARSKKKTPNPLSPLLPPSPPALLPTEEVLRSQPPPKSPVPAMGPMAAEGGPPPAPLNVVPPGAPGEEAEVRPRPIIPMLYVLPHTNTADGDRERTAHPQLAPMELGPEDESQAQAGDAQVGD